MVISKFIECQSKAKCRAPAYSRALSLFTIPLSSYELAQDPCTVIASRKAYFTLHSLHCKIGHQLI